MVGFSAFGKSGGHLVGAAVRAITAKLVSQNTRKFELLLCDLVAVPLPLVGREPDAQDRKMVHAVSAANLEHGAGFLASQLHSAGNNPDRPEICARAVPPLWFGATFRALG